MENENRMTRVRHVIEVVRARIDVVLVAILSVLATLPFGRILVSYHFLLDVAGGAAIAAVVVIGLGRRASVIPVVAGTVLFAAYLVLLVLRASPGAAWTDLTSTWSALLTSTTPAVASPTIIAGPVLLGWAATMIGGLIAVRSRLSAVPVVPPLIVLIVALAFAGTAAPGSILYPVVLVLVILAILLVRGLEPGAKAKGVRQWTPLLAVVAIALVVAVGVTAGAPVGSTQSRYDLRARYNPPINMSNQVTPLALVTPSLQNTSTTPVFTVTFSHLPRTTTLIPIAYLESYDGAVWGAQAPFSLAGPELPPGAAGSAPTVTVRQTYKLTPDPQTPGHSTYPSAFLPALEGARTIEGTTLGYDRTTGTLVEPAGPGANLTYTVESDVPQISPAAIQHARPGVDPTVATLALPPANESWPLGITEFADKYGTGKTPLARLANLETELRSGKTFGFPEQPQQARPGHSLFILGDFLSLTGKDAYTNIGDSEQYAAAFAVLARVEGLPSRVVVGYKIPDKDETAAVTGRPVTILPDDMYAWAQVNVNGVGWVSYDPTNTTPKNAPPLNHNTPPPPTPPTSPNTGSGGAGTNAPPPVKVTHHHHTFPWVVIVIILVAVPGLVLAAKKTRRQIRRERGTPSDQVVGAWREARDHLRDRRIPVRRSATLSEVAAGCAGADEVDLGDRINELGLLVDRAIYSPTEPADEDVDAAWEAESGVRDALKGGTDPASRLRSLAATFDPRTLVDSVRR